MTFVFLLNLSPGHIEICYKFEQRAIFLKYGHPYLNIFLEVKSKSLRTTLLFVLLLNLLACKHSEVSRDLKAELLKREQQLMNAIAVGDTLLWHATLHEDCVITIEDGSTLTRDELIASMKPLPKGYIGKIKVIEPRFYHSGNTAILSFIDDEYLNLYNQKIHTQYRQMDTWINFNGEWKIVAMQVFEIPKNPQPISVDEAILQKYVGTYELASNRKCKIIVEDGKIYAKKDADDLEELFAETENVFFRKTNGRVRVIFINAEGKGCKMIERRAGEDLVWEKVD